MSAELYGGNWSENFGLSTEDDDYAFALQLSEYANNSEESNTKNNGNLNSHVADAAKKPLSVTDASWELIDPVPDIRELFLQFNDTYFNGKVACVEVKWSSKMTTCAGVCRYEGRGGLCCVSLSLPLLKLRPRSDLVNTLLHEMIHALLFVTNNNKDHGAHGEEFHKHMYRINKESGSNITVYHSFHDEVNLYKQHWWKCDGPCAKRHPFYGIVRRAMNRAPGPNDRWWSDHQKSCGGVFKKVKEPDKVEKKKKSKDVEKDNVKNTGSSTNKIKDFSNLSDKLNNKSNNEVSNHNTEIIKNTSVWNNNKSTSSKIGSFQDIRGKTTESQVFSGSSNSSSGNVHGFKMTARKNNEAVVPNFSGRGTKMSASSEKDTIKHSTSSSLGSRESFLKRIENDMLKSKGVKRTAEKSENISEKTGIENNMLKSKGVKRTAEKSEKKTDDIGGCKKARILTDNNNTAKTEDLLPSTCKLVSDVIRINDSADDDLLSSIDQSFLSDDVNLVECPACPARVPEHKLNEHLDKCLAT